MFEEFDRLPQQTKIDFLESAIREITAQLDEMTDGRDFNMELLGIRFRLTILKHKDGKKYGHRIEELEKAHADLQAEYDRLRDDMELLEDERELYRQILSSW